MKCVQGFNPATRMTNVCQKQQDKKLSQTLLNLRLRQFLSIDSNRVHKINSVGLQLAPFLRRCTGKPLFVRLAKIGDVVKADSYLVDDEVYLLLGTKNGVHMVKTSHLLEIKYARLVAEQCSMQSSMLGSRDFLLVTNCPQGIRLHRVSYDSNVTNTSYIYQEEAKAIDISPSLDSSIGAYAILYTTSSHLRLRIIDNSLITVQDTLVDSGSRGRLIPLSRGYLVISYDTTSSTTLCKHGDIIKNNSIKFDNNVVYQPKSDSVLLIGTIGDMVSVYDYTQSLETSYHISIPYAKPVYLNEYLMVLNSNQNVSPYVNNYGDTDGYILRYN